MKTAIIYGSCTGNTESTAELLRDQWGEDIELLDVSGVEPENLSQYQLLIVGSSTWDVGELQYDWNDLYDRLDEGDIDLANVDVVFFGLGDQAGYPDTYQDAMGILYERFKKAGAKVGKGFTDPSDDDFEASKALIDDKFCGLALDQNCQPDKTDSRVAHWVAQLKEELNLAVAA